MFLTSVQRSLCLSLGFPCPLLLSQELLKLMLRSGSTIICVHSNQQQDRNCCYFYIFYFSKHYKTLNLSKVWMLKISLIIFSCKCHLQRSECWTMKQKSQFLWDLMLTTCSVVLDPLIFVIRSKNYLEVSSQLHISMILSVFGLSYYYTLESSAPLRGASFQLLRRAAAFGCKRWGPSGPTV